MSLFFGDVFKGLTVLDGSGEFLLELFGFFSHEFTGELFLEIDGHSNFGLLIGEGD